MPNSSNCHRPFPGYTLHGLCWTCLFKGSPHLPKCKLRLASTNPSRQRRFNLLYLPLPSYRPRDIPWLIHNLPRLNNWNCNFIFNYSNSFFRLCTPLGANILLRCNRNHKPIFCYPLHRNSPCAMNLRGICSGKCHPNPILLLPLFTPLYCNSCRYGPHLIPSPSGS